MSPVEKSTSGGGGGSGVIYAPLTNQNVPDLIFTNAGDVIMAPD